MRNGAVEAATVALLLMAGARAEFPTAFARGRALRWCGGLGELLGVDDDNLTRGEVLYMCDQKHPCGGFGDRLRATAMMWLYALDEGARFELHWGRPVDLSAGGVLETTVGHGWSTQAGQKRPMGLRPKARAGGPLRLRLQYDEIFGSRPHNRAELAQLERTLDAKAPRNREGNIKCAWAEVLARGGTVSVRTNGRYHGTPCPRKPGDQVGVWARAVNKRTPEGTHSTDNDRSWPRGTVATGIDRVLGCGAFAARTSKLGCARHS